MTARSAYTDGVVHDLSATLERHLACADGSAFDRKVRRSTAAAPQHGAREISPQRISPSGAVNHCGILKPTLAIHARHTVARLSLYQNEECARSSSFAGKHNTNVPTVCVSVWTNTSESPRLLSFEASPPHPPSYL